MTEMQDAIKLLRDSIFDYHAVQNVHDSVDEACADLNDVVHMRGWHLLKKETQAEIRLLHKKLDDLHHRMYDQVHDMRTDADLRYNKLSKKTQ